MHTRDGASLSDLIIASRNGLRAISLTTTLLHIVVRKVWRSSSWPGSPDPQRKCAVESVRQQEEQKNKGDEEIGDEVNGEVEEVTQRAHET